jgi:Flp pilus assembly protein protease CpaA
MRPPLPLVIFALALAAVAAWSDARRGRIPNWLTLPVLAGAPVTYALLARSQASVLGLPAPVFAASWSLSAALLAGLVPFLLFKARLAGAGDAKLLAALGALLLPEVALAAEFSAFAAAAFFVAARLAYRGDLLRTLGETLIYALRGVGKPSAKAIARAPSALGEQLRFGPFILLGTLISPLVARGLS